MTMKTVTMVKSDGHKVRPSISRNRYRNAVLLTMGLGLASLAAATFAVSSRAIVWNGSTSLPQGLYVRKHAVSLQRGDLVLFWLPQDARALADQRRYIPASVPALKPIAAVAGDAVCAHNDTITINGIRVASRRQNDPSGRPLPSWNGCQTLATDQIFVLSTYAADSYDGRYFGPVSTSAILEKVAPLWTF